MAYLLYPEIEDRAEAEQMLSDDFSIALWDTPGIDKEKKSMWIYCWLKTGLFLTEMNEHLLTKADKREWHRAAREYQKMRPNIGAEIARARKRVKRRAA